MYTFLQSNAVFQQNDSGEGPAHQDSSVPDNPGGDNLIKVDDSDSSPSCAGDEEEDEDSDDPDKLWCICQQPHNDRLLKFATARLYMSISLLLYVHVYMYNGLVHIYTCTKHMLYPTRSWTGLYTSTCTLYLHVTTTCLFV